MIIEYVRIAVLDAYDNILTFLDNRLPKALHYYNDTLTEYLKGSAYTYAFTTSADHHDSQYLVEGNKIAFEYRDKSYYLNIMTVEKDEYTVTVQAFGLLFELLNEDKEAFSATEAMTFAEYLDEFDPEHIITLGNNEVPDKSITYEWTGTESMLARLYSLATVFGAEIEFVAQLNQNYSLAGIVMNVYQEHGDTVQGIGTNRTDQILRYGKDVDGIRKTSDITEIYTAIRPTGNDGLTIADVVINEYDADGNLEYSSPQGNRNIYAVQARDRFPSNLTAPSTERYVAMVWSYSTDDVNVLAGQALTRLKEACTPQVSYEVSGYIDANIGDTFTIQDTGYTPQLLLEARVTEQQRSFTDPASNKTTFDNFRELQSEVDQSLLDRVEELIEANKSYSAYINSNNGLIFKNNTGSTTLTATVTSGITDVTADMTINWFKDGAAAGSGTTLTVNASDVSETAVYSIQAVNGNGDIVATAQVTIADVYDGAAGQPGPAGTSSYTHIAYANSADGTVDFSVTDSNREYIGFYVDNVQADSTDPSKYKWTLIKGADGSQGVPGTPGADGRTPYFHVAYANSADGHTGFSTTEADGKTYMGTYTDYTAADSDDPDDYLWMKTQGPEGEQGEQGEPGQDGVGVASVDVQYYSSTSNTSLAGGNWATTPPEWENGRYIWSKTVITYTNGTTEETQPVCITGAAGQSGSDGSNGVGVSSIVEQYYSSTSPTTPTGGSWSDTYPGWQEGRYIWTRSIITYTDGATTTTTAICVTGPKGDTGATGEPGPAGADGRTTYFHIKYSNNANGNPMTETPSKYIGTYVDFTQADSNDYTDYTWSQFQGDPGAQGIPGTNGENGQTSYLHIAYANSADGQTDFSTTDATGRAYMGTCVDFNQADPTTPASYTWVKTQGETGPAGEPGTAGENGQDGKMLYGECEHTLASTASKLAFLNEGTISDDDLYVGITVSIHFTYGNTAASPSLTLGSSTNYPIVTNGTNSAYWTAGANVLFTWDGTYWQVASQPVYASTVTVGNSAGRNVRIDEDSVDVRNGADTLASFGETSFVGNPDGSRTIFNEMGIDIVCQYGSTSYDWLGISSGGVTLANGTAEAPDVDTLEQLMIFNSVDKTVNIPNLRTRGNNIPLISDDIQRGITGNYQVTGGSNVLVGATFPTAFSKEPVVVATAMPGTTDQQASFEISIISVRTNGFTALVTNRGSSTYFVKLAWMAMLPTE